MITVLLLAAAEKLINIAINSDEITQDGLEPLAGKVLRLNMIIPEVHLDIIFNYEHIRFEPVTSVMTAEGTTESYERSKSIKTRQKANTQQSGNTPSHPDCVINVDNPAQLLNLMRSAEGNLPIEGDSKVLMQLKQLIAGFDPDIAGQLEPFIGRTMASQLQMLISHLKGGLRHSAKRAFDDVSDWANDVAGNVTLDPIDKAESDELKQQLLKLRADIEREEARLAAIKLEQEYLKK